LRADNRLMSKDAFETIRSINRPHAPDDATGDFIYKAYLLLKEAPATLEKWARQRAFESIAANLYSWRVVGISEAALRRIDQTGTNRSLQRGHWFQRTDRYEAMFSSSAPPMQRDELLRFFFEHDTTVVILKEENNARDDHNAWGKIVPVPDGLFTTRGYGFNVRKRFELPWVKKQVAELDGKSLFAAT
jgi:hypothetical protein